MASGSSRLLDSHPVDAQKRRIIIASSYKSFAQVFLPNPIGTRPFITRSPIRRGYTAGAYELRAALRLVSETCCLLAVGKQELVASREFADLSLAKGPRPGDVLVVVTAELEMPRDVSKRSRGMRLRTIHCSQADCERSLVGIPPEKEAHSTTAGGKFAVRSHLARPRRSSKEEVGMWEPLRTANYLYYFSSFP